MTQKLRTLAAYVEDLAKTWLLITNSRESDVLIWPLHGEHTHTGKILIHIDKS